MIFCGGKLIFCGEKWLEIWIPLFSWMKNRLEIGIWNMISCDKIYDLEIFSWVNESETLISLVLQQLELLLHLHLGNL